ncbi:MAG: L-threonylcarbamoyladenylate synthase [Pirellulales bacterium]
MQSLPEPATPTEVLQIDPRAPDERALVRAAEVLRSGGLVAFPTETVYGLGALALDEQAVARIFAAKGRPADNPVIVHVADVAAARVLAAIWPAAAATLAQAFWPGPLTLVVERAPQVPAIVTAGGATVALRCPAHPVALALLRAVGAPIAAPSANRSTRLSPTTAGHVLKQLAGRVPLVLDGGPAGGGLESTVVDVSVEPPRLLRPGLIGLAALESALGRPLAECGLRPAIPAPARSPGQMAIHYAPVVPLELANDAARRVAELLDQGRQTGWLSLGEPGTAGRASLERIDLPRDAAGYAAGLYAALHRLEDAGVERIVVSSPPTAPEWQAVHDRLNRAAAREAPTDNESRLQ